MDKKNTGDREQLAIVSRDGDAEASCEKGLCEIYDLCSVSRNGQRSEGGVVGNLPLSL